MDNTTDTHTPADRTPGIPDTSAVPGYAAEVDPRSLTGLAKILFEHDGWDVEGPLRDPDNPAVYTCACKEWRMADNFTDNMTGDEEDQSFDRLAASYAVHVAELCYRAFEEDHKRGQA